MTSSRLASIVLWTLVFLAVDLVATRHTVQAEPVVVTATMYSCQPHRSNRMANTPGMCQVTRWGGDVHAPGLACPAAWRGQLYEVPGYGVLVCDDTGPYETFYGLPHIDIRSTSYAEAARFGVQQLVIQQVASPAHQGSAPPTAAPTATITRWPRYKLPMP